MSTNSRLRNIVLVTGYDYTRLDSQESMRSFTRVAKARCAEIFSRSSQNQAVRLCGGSVRVVMMDFASGIVSVMEQNATGEVREETVARYAPITPANYQWQRPGRWVFCQHADGVMSILDVYDFVREIGRREPGTLVELSFFCHGWAGGPTLVNSDDTIERSTSRPAREDDRRDPLDKDGRRFKDFRLPTMSPEDLALMRRAFCDGGYLWNWSCNNSLASSDVLYQAVRNEPSPLEQATDPDRRLHFTFTHHEQSAYFDVDPDFFPRTVRSAVEQLLFDRSILEVTEFLWGRILATYNAQAALALDKCCFGALPGTTSDLERSGRFPQMVVPHSPGYAENLLNELRFYEKHMDIGFDLEGRRFGEYRPEVLQQVMHRARQPTRIRPAISPVS
jgi:hypothetical protein